MTRTLALNRDIECAQVLSLGRPVSSPTLTLDVYRVAKAPSQMLKANREDAQCYEPSLGPTGLATHQSTLAIRGHWLTVAS